MNKTAFIVGGGGRVGSTIAYAIALSKSVEDIVLIDVANDLAHGQAMDISHATAHTNGVHVRAGDYSEIKHGDIVIIACGAAMQPGSTRLDLLAINSQIVREVVKNITKHQQEVHLIMVTNPVDVLTYVALKESGLPEANVFGTGTTLDTARLRVQLARQLHVSQQEIEAYVLGEHGDSSFAAVSGIRVGGVPLESFPGFKTEMIKSLNNDVRSSAYKIKQTKGTSHYGIGQIVARLVEALQQSSASIFPVCSLTNGEYGLRNVVLGLPSLVSSKGVRILKDYPLNESESKLLYASAGIVEAAIGSLNRQSQLLAV